ncbi:MAG: hypothetical protein ACFFD1_09760, partial [Candidatus Thorarchaeota archaeon]
MVNHHELLPLIILLTWDEVKGPIFIDSEPPLGLSDGLKLGVQIYMIASSIFGTDEYKKEVIDIPIANLAFRSRIWIDYKFDNEIRGHRLPYMLAIGYKNPKITPILVECDEIFQDALTQYIQKGKVDLAFLHEYLIEQVAFHFNNLNEFNKILIKISKNAYFGLTSGIIIRGSVSQHGMLEKYFSTLPTTIPQGMLSQILISELNEFFFAFWSGPFSFLFQPPINLDVFQNFIKIFPSIREKLWILVRTDSSSKVDMVNLLIRVNYEPKIIEDMFNQALISASRKLISP